jgi:hypothetical protein
MGELTGIELQLAIQVRLLQNGDDLLRRESLLLHGKTLPFQV